MGPLELLLPDSVRVVFLDMDHTLVGADSDLSWKRFLISHGLCGLRDRLGAWLHYRRYRMDRLNIEKFCCFQFRQFKGRSPEEMAPLLEEHFREMVRPLIYQESRPLIRKLQQQGREVVLLTATSELIAAPTARELGIKHLIGTRLALESGEYTGETHGTYCGGPGKLEYIDAFLSERGVSRAAASYWGDSTADIPVLEEIGYPVVANPAPGLKKAAAEHGWPVVCFTLA